MRFLQMHLGQGLSLISAAFVSGSRTARDVDGLAPIWNEGHPHIFRRSADALRYGIMFFPETQSEQLNEFETDFAEFFVKKYPSFENFMYLDIPDALSDDVLLDIRQRGYVEVVEHVLTVKHHDVNSGTMNAQDSLYWNKLALSTEDYDKPFNKERGEFLGLGFNSVIYVVDSGIDDHDQFDERINREKSKGFNGRTDSFDCRGHGTQVAGVIAGSSTGIARKAQIVSYAVMDCLTGVTSTDVILDALDAFNNDINLHRNEGSASAMFQTSHVINLSNGFYESAATDLSLLMAEKKILDNGGVVVRAAGNQGKEACDFGLKLPDSITVGSINSKMEIAGHSNYGACVDIFAPGEDIVVPIYSKLGTKGEGLGVSTGTSFAAPLVAGAVANMMSLQNTETYFLVSRKKVNRVGRGAVDYILGAAKRDVIKNLPADTPNLLLQMEYAPASLPATPDTPVFKLIKDTTQASIALCDDSRAGHVYEKISDANLEDCHQAMIDRYEPLGYNMFTYNPLQQECILVHCPDRVIYIEGLNAGPGYYYMYAGEVSVPAVHGRYKLTRHSTRDQIYSCTGATTHIVNKVNSLTDCSEKAEFTKANFFNFQLSTHKCEMLSCPPQSEFMVTRPETDDWVAYADYEKHVTQRKVGDFRFVPSNRLDLSGEDKCVFVTNDQFPIATAADDCMVKATSKRKTMGNMFYLTLQGGLGEFRCTIFQCEGDINDGIAEDHSWLTWGNTHETAYNTSYMQLTYAADTLMPAKHKNFELITGKSGYSSSRYKLDCQNYQKVQDISLEECMSYTLLVGGNALNFRQPYDMCEPLLCGVNYGTVYGSETNWMMYVNYNTLIEEPTQLLVRLDPLIDQVALTTVYDRTDVIDYSLGNRYGTEYKELVVSMTKVEDLEFFINHPDVLSVEQVGIRNLESRIYDTSLQQTTSSPLENILYQQEGGFIDYSNTLYHFPQQETHELEKDESSPQELGSKSFNNLNKKYSSANELYGSFGSMSYNSLTGGKGDNKFLGEFGLSILSGDFDLKFFTSDLGLSLLSGDFGLPMLHGDFGLSMLHGDHGLSILNGDFGLGLLNGDFGLSSLHGDFGLSFLHGDHGLPLLHGDYGLSLLNGDFGLSLLNGDFGLSFLHGDHALPMLHGDFSYPTLVGIQSIPEFNGDSGNDGLIRNMFFRENGRLVEFAESDASVWNYVAGDTTTAIEQFPYRSENFASAIRGPKQFFKIVDETNKSLHLNCNDYQLYDNIGSVDECAAKTGERADVVPGKTFGTPNFVYGTVKFSSYSIAFTTCSFEPTCTGFSQISDGEYVLHSGEANVDSGILSFRMSDKTERFDGFTLEGLTALGAVTYATSDEAFRACRRELTCQGFTQTNNGPFTLYSGGKLIASPLDTTFMLVKDRFGFMYHPTSNRCVVQTCQKGLYTTITSEKGWVTYVATGFYPQNYKSFDLVPFNGKAKVTCQNNEESGARYSGVMSVEACLSFADSQHSEEVITYQVSTGYCEMLYCSGDNYKWVQTDDSDRYVYFKNGVDSQVFISVTFEEQESAELDAWVLDAFKTGYTVHKVEFGNTGCQEDITESFKRFYSFSRIYANLTNISNDLANQANPCGGNQNIITINLALSDTEVSSTIADWHHGVKQENQHMTSVSGNPSKANIKNGSVGYLALSVWALADTSAQFSIQLNGTSTIFVYVGNDDFENFDSHKIEMNTNSCGTTDFCPVQSSVSLTKGLNNFFVVLDQGAQVGNIKLLDTNALFYKNAKQKEIRWSDYVTLSTGFANIYNSGTHLVGVSSVESVGGTLTVNPKQNETEYSKFQLLSPPWESGGDDDCIHWHDSVVLSAMHNVEEASNCGAYGCRVAALTGENRRRSVGERRRQNTVISKGSKPEDKTISKEKKARSASRKHTVIKEVVKKSDLSRENKPQHHYDSKPKNEEQPTETDANQNDRSRRTTAQGYTTHENSACGGTMEFMEMDYDSSVACIDACDASPLCEAVAINNGMCQFVSDITITPESGSTCLVKDPTQVYDYLESVSGDCTLYENNGKTCFRTPNYPSNYGNHKYCRVKIKAFGTLEINDFHVEDKYDAMFIGAETYDTSNYLDMEARALSPRDTISFFSDYTTSEAGVDLCFIADPIQPPPPVVEETPETPEIILPTPPTTPPESIPITDSSIYEVGSTVSFDYGGDEPSTFQIVPPGGLFRSTKHCIREGDRFALSYSRSADVGADHPNCGFHGCKVGRVEDGAFVFGKGSFLSLATFRKAPRHRPLQWKDFAIINTDFFNNGNVFGDSNLYTHSTVDNVALVSGLKADGNHVHTSFRLLPPASAKTSTGCINWNDEIVLKLNNHEFTSNDTCDSMYGCRTAHLDADMIIRFRQPSDTPYTFKLRNPDGVNSEGCIRSGEQIRLTANDSETSPVNLISFQTFF